MTFLPNLLSPPSLLPLPHPLNHHHYRTLHKSHQSPRKSFQTSELSHSTSPTPPPWRISKDPQHIPTELPTQAMPSTRTPHTDAKMRPTAAD
ncbi:hypothetical protein AKJ16_DCAP08883 [Drosera capensis]